MARLSALESATSRFHIRNRSNTCTAWTSRNLLVQKKRRSQSNLSISVKRPSEKPSRELSASLEPSAGHDHQSTNPPEFGRPNAREHFHNPHGITTEQHAKDQTRPSIIDHPSSSRCSSDQKGMIWGEQSDTILALPPRNPKPGYVEKRIRRRGRRCCECRKVHEDNRRCDHDCENCWECQSSMYVTCTKFRTAD